MYYSSSMALVTPDACLVDTTPPTFAGISTLTALATGSLLASWPEASDANGPIEYLLYLNKQSEPSSELFDDSNLVQITKNLSAALFTDAELDVLVSGQSYRVGVRAKDAIGNIEYNTVSLIATSSGVPDLSLSEFIKVVKAVMANQASNIESKIGLDEVTTKIETQEVTSKVTVDPEIKC